MLPEVRGPIRPLEGPVLRSAVVKYPTWGTAVGRATGLSVQC